MKSLACFGCTTLILLSTHLQAQEDQFADFDMDEEIQPAASFDNVIRVYLQGVSDDNHQFGQFNSLDERGLSISGDVMLKSASDSTNHAWKFNATHLGESDRALLLDWRSSDQLRLKLDYRETPFHDNDTGMTPFLGTSSLLLPANWQPASLTSGFDDSLSVRPLAIESLRKQLSVAADKHFSNGLVLQASAMIEDKTGTRLSGAAIYSNAANPQAVLLPLVIDQQSIEYRTNIEFSNRTLNLSADVFYRLFNNQSPTMSWQNPYSSGLGAQVDYPAGVGSLANAPDYALQQFSFGAGYKLSDSSRIVINGSTSTTTQDTDLEPYSSNSLLLQSALPVTSLNDDLQTDKLKLDYSFRPHPRITLFLDYEYSSRENTMDQYAWLPLRGDGANELSSDLALSNRPLSQEKDQYQFKALWRGTKRSRIQLTYEYIEDYRNFASVANTEEERVSIAINLPQTDTMTHKVTLSVSNLAGSTYEWSRSYFQELSVNLINQIPEDQRWTNHPLLRQYHIANNHKTGVKWVSTYRPNDRWQFQLMAASDEVKFDKSELGLTQTSTYQMSVNAHFQASDKQSLTLWADYRDDFQSLLGRDFNGGIQKPANQIVTPLSEGSDPARNYSVAQNNDTIAFGINGEWQLNERLVWTSSYTCLVNAEDYGIGTGGARDLSAEDFPTIDIEMHKLANQLSWQLNDSVSLSLTHQYFRATNADWQWLTGTQTSVEKLLLNNQRNTNESLHHVMVSASYQF